MPQYAQSGDIYAIQELFDECFPEDIKFNRWFFENKLRTEDTVVYKINGSIVGMLIRMPQVIKGVGNSTYIYGACTRNEYRRRGVMSGLLKFSHNEDIKRGVICSMLIPAEEWLFDFYAQYGYKVSCYLDKADFNIKHKESEYILRKAGKRDISILDELYSNSLKDRNYVIRDREYWNDLLNMLWELGGEALLITEGNRILGYALLWNGNEPYIQELCCEDENDMDMVTCAVMQSLKVESIKITAIKKRTHKPFAMVKYYDKDNSYEFYANMLWN